MTVHPDAIPLATPIPRGVLPTIDDFRGVDVRGSTVARIFTPPRWGGPPGPCGCGCALTRATSRGWEVIDFATDVLHAALLPWQRWWLIHAFELSTTVHALTGVRRLRYRTLLTLVARQQGKSWLLRVVALWALYVRRVGMVLGAAQSLDIARECWLGAIDLARDAPECNAEIPTQGGIRYANGEQCLTLVDGQRYRITAATRGAGRGLSVDVLLLDELREHRDYLAWAALSKTTLARPEALICAVSNAGDDSSVVLNDLRARALDTIARARAEREECGPSDADTADPAGGLFLAEWSAPEGLALDDPRGWSAAMPGLNVDVIGSDGSYLPAPITTEAVLGFLVTDPPGVFRTELLCQRVGTLDTAFDPLDWQRCADPTFTLRGVRDAVAVCVDVALDGEHVTACGAAKLPGGWVGGQYTAGRVGVAVLGAWEGRAAVMAAERALPGLLAAIMPIEIGWFPSSPVGGLGPILRGLRRTTRRIVPQVRDGQIILDDEHEAARLSAVMEREAAQGLADLMRTARLVQPDDPLLNSQVLAAGRVDAPGGESGWRLTRKGGGHCDAAYAAAGAVHLARSAPEVARQPMRAKIY
ncbi:MAG TPA: hypothetical protein VIU11_14400 [Nakamurella sp.]